MIFPAAVQRCLEKIKQKLKELHVVAKVAELWPSE